MKVVRLLLPGRYEDAFVYMGRIAVLKEDRTLRIFDLDKIVEDIEDRDPQLRPVATLMFSRNDWLSSAVFRTLSRNESIDTSIAQAFRIFPQPYYEVSLEFLVREHDLHIPAHIILDMNIYNSRLYVGTDAGLFHLDFEWRNGGELRSGEPRKRIDARCISTSVGFGAVNASCEDEGLFSSVDDFEWIRAKRQHRMRRIAKRSLRTNWLHHDLVNYSTTTQPVLLRSKYKSLKQSPQSEERERRVITAIDPEPLDLQYLFEAIRERFGIRKESIQFAYNSTSVFFIHTVEGKFYSVGIKHSDRANPQLRFTKTYKGAGARVLSVNPTNVGLVIEVDHRVLLFANQEWYPIWESDVISVRTFPRSRRFKNLVAITAEEGVVLVGLFDERYK